MTGRLLREVAPTEARGVVVLVDEVHPWTKSLRHGDRNAVEGLEMPVPPKEDG